IAPSDAVADDVTDAGLAAADLEAVAVPCSPGARMDVAVAHGPTVLDEDGHFLRDEIPTIVGVPPRAATAKYRGFAFGLIMHAEPVGVFTVALMRERIVVVVRIAIQHLMASERGVDEHPR